MATVFLSKQRNIKSKIKIINLRQKNWKETNKEKIHSNGLLTEVKAQKTHRESQAEWKQPEFCGFDAAAGVSHQALSIILCHV